MGRSTTPVYRIEVTAKSGQTYKMCWRIKAQYGTPGNGKPTDANLAKWVDGFEKSTQPGGANKHIEGDDGKIVTARIVRQSTGEVVATYKADN